MSERAGPAPPDDLARSAREKGWPEGLLERALEAGIPVWSLRGWLHWQPPEAIERRIQWHERLTFGPLRGREATLADNDAFCELWANAPERVGDFEVTSLRGPFAFAQFRLQENVNLFVIAEGNRLLASCGFSRRNVLIGGRRVSVRYGQALRVHRDVRRQGFGDQVRTLSAAAATAGWSIGQYDLMRSQNQAVVSWWKRYVPDSYANVPEREGAVPGIPVSVLRIPPAPAADAAGIRPTRRADVPRCVELVNRTHAGLDLFRPYSSDFLEHRLDQGIWGELPPDWPHVYGWPDHAVVEENGRVVACAGLWDRGRDLRERWRHVETGEERLVSDAALMDFGYEAGAEDAMARLVRWLGGRTHQLGRTHLLAPLQHLPELAERLGDHDPVPDVRSLRWTLRELPIERPYSDLAYW